MRLTVLPLSKDNSGQRLIFSGVVIEAWCASRVRVVTWTKASPSLMAVKGRALLTSMRTSKTLRPSLSTSIYGHCNHTKTYAIQKKFLQACKKRSTI
jgi:hypothetical protein